MFSIHCFVYPVLYLLFQQQIFAAIWPTQLSSNIKILGLFPDAENTSDPTDLSVHSRALFKSAILLSQRYNLTVDGQFIEYISSQTDSNIINALEDSCEAVSNTNIIGIVGPAFSREAHVIGEFAQRIQIPVISYAATNPDLSSRVAYPTFFRTVPSDNSAALAIVSLFNRFNWSSCIIIYQNDAFGSNGAKIITDAFVNNDLTVRDTILYDVASHHIQGNLQSTLTKSASRIVILWAEYPIAADILKQAIHLNVVGPLFTWILSDTIDFDDFNETQYDALTGILTVEPVTGSVVNAPTNTTLLQSAYDIWQQYEPETFPGTTKISNYALFAFDAAWSLILSIYKLCSTTTINSSCISYSGSSFCFNRRFDQSNAVLNALSQLSFDGVSGPIQFTVNSTDRTSGSYYKVQNIQSLENISRFVPVLSYSESDGWKSYSDMSYIIWPGNTLDKPSGRAILRGVNLRIGVIAAVPFTIVMEELDPNGESTTKLTGFVPELIDLLQEHMGFTSSIIVAPSNLTYAEIIGMVASGVYDIVVGDVTITSQRREIVSFSNSIFDNSLRIISRNSLYTSTDLTSFLKPFSRGLWLLLFCAGVFAGILFCLIERYDNKDLQQRSLLSQCAMSIWYSFGNIVGYGGAFEASTAAGRLLTAGLYVLSLIILASYTANLASDLTLQKTQGIISGIDDIKNGKIPSHRIGIREGTAMEEYYLREISKRSKNYYPLKSLDEAYDRLLDNTIDASIIDAAFGEYLTNNIYCNLTLLGEGFDSGAFGIAMSKDWLYAHDLDVNILKIRESGELEHLRAKWFQGKICAHTLETSTAMKIEHLGGLFLTFAIFCILSMILFLWMKRRFIIDPITIRFYSKHESNKAEKYELHGGFPDKI